MIAQIVVFFSRKTDAQQKTNFAFRSTKIAQKFCEWKPYFQRVEMRKLLVEKPRFKIISFQTYEH